MTVYFPLLSRSLSSAAFVVSLILTVATLDSVVAAAGPAAPQTAMIATATMAVAQG